LNIFTIILTIIAVFVLLSTIFTLTACMLSSRISQKEEFVELLVFAVNNQMARSLAVEDQAE
jgi:hypothetical protein